MQRPFFFASRLSRLLCSSVLLLPICVSAQSIKITLPNATTCTYTTGQVTNNATPGQLQATATGTPTGTGCGSTTTTTTSSVPAATFGPASDLSASLTSLAGGTAAGTTFAFQPLYAASCTGSIQTTTGTGTGSFTNGNTLCGNGAAACSSGTPLSIAATFTNTSTTAQSTYAVSVTCNAATGAVPASTQSKTVALTQAAAGGGGGGGGSGCTTAPTIASSTTGIANFTQFTGSHSVSYFSNGTKTVDVTRFDSIYSYAWPGASVVADFSLPNANYISAVFTVPAGYMTAANAPSNLYGEYYINGSGYSAPVSMTISKSCGDFSNPVNYPTSSVVAGCFVNKRTADQYIAWTKSGSCQLTNGTTYYLNIINADISLVTANGGGTAASTRNGNCSGACSVPIQNGPGSWQGYTPQ